MAIATLVALIAIVIAVGLSMLDQGNDAQVGQPVDAAAQPAAPASSVEESAPVAGPTGPSEAEQALNPPPANADVPTDVGEGTVLETWHTTYDNGQTAYFITVENRTTHSWVSGTFDEVSGRPDPDTLTVGAQHAKIIGDRWYLQLSPAANNGITFEEKG